MNDTTPAWLITGATGFLGRHVIEAIAELVPASRIVALVRDKSGAASLDYLSGAGLVEGSVLEPREWEDDPRLGELAGIFHLAAEVRHSRRAAAPMLQLNVEGTTAMVRLAARRNCRILFASTSGTVGCSANPRDAPDEDAPFCESVVGGWPYYASKIRAEKEARRLAQETGVGLVIVRPPVLLGPGDHRYRSTGNILRLLRNRLPFILDGGMHFTDVRDAARAMVRAMIHPDPKPVYNLPGTASTLDEFFRMAADRAGMAPRWKILPRRILWYAARLNELAGRRLHVLPDPVVIEMAGHYWGLSSKYSAADLGYRPRDPAQTLADTIDWIRRDTSRRGISG